MAPLGRNLVLVLALGLHPLLSVDASRLPRAILSGNRCHRSARALLALRGGAEASSSTITVRIRTKDGMKRATVDAGASLRDLQRMLLRDYKYKLEHQRISRSPGGADPFDADVDGDASLSDLGVTNGSMLHLQMKPPAGAASVAAPAPPTAAAVSTSGGGGASRGGRRARRTTMADFEEERKAFEVVLEAPKAAACEFVSVEPGASAAFADYVLDNEFEEHRIALLFGRFVDPPGVGGGKRGVQVDVLYEPPQDCTAEGMALDESDEAKEEVQRAFELAKALGMSLVGVAYAHPPRHHTMEVSELSMIVSQRAASVEAAAEASPSSAADLFVGMRFRPVYEGEPIDGDVTAEAYQPTAQTVDLTTKGVLVGCDPTGDHAGHAALIKGSGLQFKLGPKEEEVADLSYFVARVHDLAQPYAPPPFGPFRRAFPVANRGGAPLRKFHLRGFLEKQHAAGIEFATSALDFQLLLHVSSLLPSKLLAALCEALPVVKASSSRKARDAAAKAIGDAEAWLVRYAGVGAAEAPKGRR